MNWKWNVMFKLLIVVVKKINNLNWKMKVYTEEANCGLSILVGFNSLIVIEFTMVLSIS